MADADGLAELQRLGARSVPVVSRGDAFVFGQVIKDVVDFLGLEDDTAPVLSPDELKRRYDGILETAIGLVRAMPDDRLEDQLPNRPRSWLVLMHHVFQIPVAFLDMEDTGETLTYETMVAPPPDDMATSAAIAAFGEAVRARFKAWAERTVWHSTQHVRQVGSLLEQAGVAPARRLTAADIEGLPLTDKIWDEAQA